MQYPIISLLSTKEPPSLLSARLFLLGILYCHYPTHQLHLPPHLYLIVSQIVHCPELPQPRLQDIVPCYQAIHQKGHLHVQPGISIHIRGQQDHVAVCEQRFGLLSVVLEGHPDPGSQAVRAWVQQTDPVQSHVLLLCKHFDIGLETHNDLFLPCDGHNKGESQVLEPDTELFLFLNLEYRIISQVSEVFDELQLTEPLQNVGENAQVLIEHSIFLQTELALALKDMLFYLKGHLRCFYLLLVVCLGNLVHLEVFFFQDTIGKAFQEDSLPFQEQGEVGYLFSCLEDGVCIDSEKKVFLVHEDVLLQSLQEPDVGGGILVKNREPLFLCSVAGNQRVLFALSHPSVELDELIYHYVLIILNTIVLVHGQERCLLGNSVEQLLQMPHELEKCQGCPTLLWDSLALDEDGDLVGVHLQVRLLELQSLFDVCCHEPSVDYLVHKLNSALPVNLFVLKWDHLQLHQLLRGVLKEQVTKL